MFKKRLRRIRGNIEKIAETVRYYYNLCREESTKEAFLFCKRQLCWLLRKIAPKKIKGEVQFGTGDPATTGELMGAVSILLPIYSYSVELSPDFEQKILEGEIEAEGRLRGWYMLVLAWNFFRNKNLRHVIKKFRR